ncbi:MAG: hypothetical protein R3Y40_09460 [Eubacteriales bacterium]
MTNGRKEAIQKLQLTSDIFWSIALKDVEACQEVVRIITGEDIKLVEVRYQETILQLNNHSIRIDTWGRDSKERNIGIEMHTQSNENRIKRNRYNIASMDVRSLETGDQYDDIPDTWGIYITQADFLKTKKGINKIERIVSGTKKEAPNGVSEYYVSLSCKGETEAQTELLRYIKNSDGVMDSKYFPNLVKRVRFLKEAEKGETVMCEIMDEIFRDGEARGDAVIIGLS